MSLSRRDFRIVTGAGFFDSTQVAARRGPKRYELDPALAVGFLD